MKATAVDRSKVMKRAWNIYRSNNPYSYTFSAALSRAWEIERADREYAAERAAAEVERIRLAAWRASDEYKAMQESKEYRTAWIAGVSAYYNNARPGQYMGD